MTQPPQREPAGPKVKLPGRRMMNISLTDELREVALMIGRGNISAGVREALLRYKADMDDGK